MKRPLVGLPSRSEHVGVAAAEAQDAVQVDVQRLIVLSISKRKEYVVSYRAMQSKVCKCHTRKQILLLKLMRQVLAHQLLMGFSSQE